MHEWKITYYITGTGASPVTDFIDSLDDRAQGKVISTIKYLRQYGVRIGSDHAKKLKGTDIWELRILGNDSTRIF